MPEQAEFIIVELGPRSFVIAHLQAGHGKDGDTTYHYVPCSDRFPLFGDARDVALKLLASLRARREGPQ
jgi:hypothetical protein